MNMDLSIINNHCNLTAPWLGLKISQSSFSYPFLFTPLIISNVKRYEKESLCMLNPSAFPYIPQQRWKEILNTMENFLNGDHTCNFIYGNS